MGFDFQKSFPWHIRFRFPLHGTLDLPSIIIFNLMFALSSQTMLDLPQTPQWWVGFDVGFHRRQTVRSFGGGFFGSGGGWLRFFCWCGCVVGLWTFVLGLDEIGMMVTLIRHFFSGLLWVCHLWVCLSWAWDLLAMGLGFACRGTGACCGFFFLFFCFLVLSFA